MTTVVFEPAPSPFFFFDRRALKAQALRARDAYRNQAPYPHAAFDNFVGEPLARELARAFPKADHPGWMRRDYKEQAARLGQLQRKGFEGVSPLLRHLLAELTGMAFIEFIETLTGHSGLLADPHFRGAGLLLTLRGGHLALHADFNRDRARNVERKVTALLYLNETWDPSWGGDLEMWNMHRTECVARYPPVLDRLIVMDHGDTHWHGHPHPLACPPDQGRAVVASYYYAASGSPDCESRSPSPSSPGSTSRERPSAHGAIWTTPACDPVDRVDLADRSGDEK